MSRNRIDLTYRATNKQRLFGSAQQYIPVWIRDEFGKWRPALFTDDQIRHAVDRARSNPEDVPRRTRWWEFWR